ncbi:MAG: hypothetical protein LUQ65_05985 [Candidatus Helarchaeota archaeon]|nr:hypothetical protein [Candidatus Helarchaeota archaeon]
MYHLAAVISKVTSKYLFYKDYWSKYPDSDPFFKFFAAYIPFVVREKENTYKMIRWDKMRIAFGNFNEVILILGASLDTSEQNIEKYLIRIYELLSGIFGDLTDVQSMAPKIEEFSRELELMIRVSASKEDLQKLDHSVEERYGVTPASEEENRRTTIQSEQAAKVQEQFALEMLDGTISKFKLFLTASVTLKETVHYEVIVDFSTYPHPPMFEFPPKLHDILGDAGETLDTIQNWDPVNPPEWVEIIQELEQKVYESETHLVEPIMEEPEAPQQKKKGFAKQLSMPSQKAPKGIPYPQDRPKEAKGITYPVDTPVSPKEAKGTPFLQPQKPPPPPPPRPKPVPFRAEPPPPEDKEVPAPPVKEKEEVTCPNCGFIFKSANEKVCQLCGSPRPE